jgi:hypothetical protein
MSRLRLPVGIDSTVSLVASPNFMTMPSPYFLFRLASVVSNALLLLLSNTGCGSGSCLLRAGGIGNPFVLIGWPVTVAAPGNGDSVLHVGKYSTNVLCLSILNDIAGLFQDGGADSCNVAPVN